MTCTGDRPIKDGQGGGGGSVEIPLTSEVDSDRADVAATSKAVKTVYDKTKENEQDIGSVASGINILYDRVRNNEDDISDIERRKADKSELIEYVDTSVPKHLSELNDDINIIKSSDKGVPNGVASLDVNGIVPLSQLPVNKKEVETVTDIEKRDELETFEGLFVYVIDATDDPVVNNGGASYIHDGIQWHLVAKGNELDAVLEWNNIKNKPLE